MLPSEALARLTAALRATVGRRVYADQIARQRAEVAKMRRDLAEIRRRLDGEVD